MGVVFFGPGNRFFAKLLLRRTLVLFASNAAFTEAKIEAGFARRAGLQLRKKYFYYKFFACINR